MREAILDILEHHPEIELAILFGSMAAGNSRRESDLDLAVAAQRPLEIEQRMALIDDLARVTGRAVDLIDLRRVGEPLLGEILVKGKRLRGSDEAYARLLTRHLLDTADFMPYRWRILAERRQAWIGH